MFAIDKNVASELMGPQPTPAVVAWITERDAQEMYLTAVSEHDGGDEGRHPTVQEVHGRPGFQAVDEQSVVPDDV